MEREVKEKAYFKERDCFLSTKRRALDKAGDSYRKAQRREKDQYARFKSKPNDPACQARYEQTREECCVKEKKYYDAFRAYDEMVKRWYAMQLHRTRQ